MIFNLHLGFGHSVLSRMERVGHVFSNQCIFKCSAPCPVFFDQSLGTLIVLNCCLDCCVQWAQQSLKRGQESRKVRLYILTTNWIWILFGQCLLIRNLYSFVLKHFQWKIDKWSWHHVGGGGGEPALSQWNQKAYLWLLAVVSLSLGIGGTNCLQGSKLN